MPDPAKTFFVTTPIYYVNARPHIGHAYTTIVADVLARRHRLLGEDTFFLTGTDEHGQKIERSATAAGIPPQQFADQVSASFRQLWHRMGITYTGSPAAPPTHGLPTVTREEIGYIRTTDPDHIRGVQHLFTQLQQNGFIYKGTYTGQYCVSDEAYVDGPPGILCPDCGRLTETVSESNYYFKLSSFQLPLLDLIESDTLRIRPDSARNEVLSFLRGNTATATQPAQPSAISEDLSSRPESLQSNDAAERPASAPAQSPGTSAASAQPLSSRPESAQNDDAAERPASAPAQSPGAPFRSQSHRDMSGNVDPQLAHPLPTTAANTPFVPGALKDLSISRTSFSWGVPVPGDEEHVIYVWLDALANYMTALGYGSDDPAAQALYKKFWPANLHLVGKEITRFHCIYWPAFLLALNPALSPSNSEKALSSQPESSETTPAVSSRPESAQSDDAAERPASAPAQSPGAPFRSQSLRDMSGNVNSATTTPPQSPGAPFMAQSLRDMSGNVNSPTTTLPQAVLSRPESSPGDDPAERPASAPAHLPAEAHKLWAEQMLPRSVIANGWLLFDNAKMSKSKGNVVRTETILTGFGGQFLAGIRDHNARELKKDPAFQPVPDPTQAEQDLFATDVLRYFLLREIPFGQDGSFSFDAMITRYNADLANGYGNLVSRVLKLAEQNLPDGWAIPEKPWIYAAEADVTTSDEELTASSFVVLDRSLDLLQLINEVWWPKHAFAGALDQIMTHISHIDRYLTFHKPWSLAKSDDPHSRRRLIEVLHTAAEAIRFTTVALYPILPFSTARVWAQLGLGSIEEAAARGDLTNLRWGGLKPGTKLGPLAPIFPRADKGLAQTMADLESTPPPSLLNVANDEHDAATTDSTAFREAPLASVAAGTVDQPAAAEAASESHPPSASQSSGAPFMAQSHRDMSGNVEGSPTPVYAEPTGSITTDPAAGPRSSSLPTGNPIAQVGGSFATTTAVPAPTTPTHVAAEPSGIFATPASATPISATPADASPQITIDDFAKVELRVAQILVAERIPKADKLLRLEVDLGHEKRQILSGIAEWYTPESLIGRRIIVITNLAPRKMRGLDSHGMLLAASGPLDPANPASAKPILATFTEDIPLGSRLK